MVSEPAKGKSMPAPAPRTRRDALFDALPDAIVVAICLLAWTVPRPLGVDLVETAAPVFFVELTLSMLLLFAGVRRLEDRAMAPRTKLSFVLVPALVLMPLCLLLLGPWALLAAAWLVGAEAMKVLTGTLDRTPPVRGAWITYREGNGGVSTEGSGLSAYVRVAGMRKRGGTRQWRVQAGHQQVMAGLTLGTGLVIAVALLFVDVPTGALVPAVVADALWAKTLMGHMVPAHVAVAAGFALFLARVPAHFEGLGPPRPEDTVASIENDPVLREITRKLDGEPSARSKPGRRR